jgi:chorismate dehydratase
MEVGQLSAGQLKLGKIGFLNVLPIYYPLESGFIAHPFQIVSGTPAYLNRLMAHGDLDLSVVSSIEYARHRERYYVLPDLSISCRGAVKSVLLLSQIPVPELAGKEILVSAQSHTSIALLKILFSIHLGSNVACTSGNCSDALSDGKFPTAFLAIGDEALRLRNHDLYPYRWDLGDAWYSRTGFPFVFALWVIQRKAVEKWNGSLMAAVETILAAKQWGADHRRLICVEAAKKRLLSCAELQEYYHCLDFDLDRNQQNGLQLFYEYLANIGEISTVPRLEIFSPLACVA